MRNGLGLRKNVFERAIKRIKIPLWIIVFMKNFTFKITNCTLLCNYVINYKHEKRVVYILVNKLVKLLILTENPQ